MPDASAAARTTSATIKTRLRDVLLLQSALNEVASRTNEQQAALRTHFLAATRRADIADQLTDEESVVASLLLYREAVGHFAIAAALSRDPSFDPGAPLAGTPFALLEDLEARGAIPKLPEAINDTKTIFGAAGDPLAFDRLAIEDALRKRARVSAAVRFLRQIVEPRTLGEIKISRFTRTGATVLVFVILLGWLGYRVTRPTNIALHKPVTINARHPASTAPLNNSGAVNGEIEASYGIHTSLGGGWVLLDLQRVYKIAEVRVFNRADGYFNDGLPLFLDLSEQGTTFKTVEQRTQPFSATSPWVYEGHGTPARYIRVRSGSYVALTEIEVYEK